jgi:hypothetical protein
VRIDAINFSRLKDNICFNLNGTQYCACVSVGDACKRANIDALVMSGFPIGGGVCDPVDHNKAKQALSMGKVVIAKALITVANMPMWSPVTRFMPACARAAPLKILPPPTTIPTSTFCLSTDLIKLAMLVNVQILMR